MERSYNHVPIKKLYTFFKKIYHEENQFNPFLLLVLVLYRVLTSKAYGSDVRAHVFPTIHICGSETISAIVRSKCAK